LLDSYVFKSNPEIFFIQLEKEREISTPAGLTNAITMLESKKSNLESRLENLRSELSGLTNEKAEIGTKTENFSREIQKLKIERDREESGLTTDDKALLERLQVKTKLQFNFGIEFEIELGYIEMLGTD